MASDSTAATAAYKKRLMVTSTAALITALLAAPITAQTATSVAQPQTATISPADVAAADIVVTGSRITTNGFQAPTPVSVLSGAALQAIAPANIADAVNRLPSLMSSVTPRSITTSVTSGALGVNQLNLRSLGSGRTLVLLDGKRIINSSITAGFSAPDVNTVPNALISRVDVVTGGASAAYGSDALTGVVNFVVDREFTGIKGSLQGGVTTYGDNKSYLGSLAVGKSFADGRGHILVSAENQHDDGIKGSRRPWNANSAVVAVNPSYTATNGQPFYILARQVGLNNGTPGGLITSGPLRGVVFGQGGTPGVFNFGTVTTANLMYGGDWQASRIDDQVDLAPRLDRVSTYGRLSFDILDNVKLYAEGQWSRTHSTSTATPNRRLGNLTIRSDNAFLPASVAARLTALGQTSFVMGTTDADIGNFLVDNKRQQSRWALGLSGKLAALGSNWTWDAYYQQSRTDLVTSTKNAAITANYLLATDAVRDPATGAIVCRSTLTAPTNGCVPFNAFGIGVNDARALKYVTGISTRTDHLKQDVAALNVSGQPFSTWAGPVSFAFGVEHRREGITGQSTALDEANAFFAGNYHASTGAYHVTEGYLETEIPLARNVGWAKSLDVNAAVRATDYSTSGYVTTWKVGGTYAPFSGLRFRATHSRDIRAPNLGELFSAGQTASGGALFDPFTNTNISNVFALKAGNPSLKPERADSNGVGLVLSPSFIPGFQASVDYYSIKIKGAVAIPGPQQVVNQCFQGNTAFCPYIQRSGGVITIVSTLPQNVALQTTRGLDFDVSYTLPLSNLFAGTDAKVQFRGMATYVISLKTTSDTGTIEGAGVLGSFANLGVVALASPKFQSTASIGYLSRAFDATVTWRHVGGGVYAHYFTSCASACPAGNTNTISSNQISANNLFDLSFALRPFAARRNLEIFAAVDNVFNQDPPLIYGVNSDGSYQGQSNFNFDRIGRTFRAGIRFKL